MIDVKQAVKSAIQHVSELFSEEQITDVTLEEVELSEDGKRWNITIGFTRQLETPLGQKTVAGPFDFLPAPTTVSTAARVYKVVEIDADTGEPLAVRIREL